MGAWSAHANPLQCPFNIEMQSCVMYLSLYKLLVCAYILIIIPRGTYLEI